MSFMFFVSYTLSVSFDDLITHMTCYDYVPIFTPIAIFFSFPFVLNPPRGKGSLIRHG